MPDGAVAIVCGGHRRTKPGRCRSCGAAVRWAVTVAGKRLPLDPEPCPGGNVLLHDNGRAEVLGPEARAAHPGVLYLPHWASCPHAARHRKGLAPAPAAPPRSAPTAARVLAALRARGLSVWAEGGLLLIDPGDKVTPGLRAALAARHGELLPEAAWQQAGLAVAVAVAALRLRPLHLLVQPRRLEPGWEEANRIGVAGWVEVARELIARGVLPPAEGGAL